MNTRPAPYTDALERALGGVVATFKREVGLQHELLSAKGDTIIARLEARHAELEGRLGKIDAYIADQVEGGITEGLRAILDASVEADNARALEVRRLAERLDETEARAQAAEARLAALEIPPDRGDEIEALRVEIGEVRAAIPEVPEPRDWTSEIEAVRSELPAPPDLSVLATREEVEAVRAAIPSMPEIPERRDWTAEIEALRAAIPADPEPPDLSGFATREEVEAVRAAIPEMQEVPEPRDWAPEIEAVAERADAAVIAALKEVDERLSNHPGVFPIAREWTDVVHYAGSVVRHAGATWQAVRDTGREPPHDDWACIAAAGTDGRTPVARGLFSEGEAYRALDIVMLDGSSFVARQDDPGPCPGDGWFLISGRGKAGKPGERGQRGEKGERGAPAEPLISAEVTEEGELILTDGGGHQVRADFYPLLDKVRRS